MPIFRPESEYQSVLRQFNPWWQGAEVPDLPPWKRAAFRDLEEWAAESSGGRALLLAGARQVGKTTLFLQVIERLLAEGTPPGNILYATFDHPLLKLAGIEETVRLWRETEAAQDGPEYLFLDEIQAEQDWQTWVKHQKDFLPRCRIAFTGSASPLICEGQESGVGRWRTVKLPTLSFFEFLQLRAIPVPELPRPRSLTEILDWPEADLRRAAHTSQELVVHFHEYLIRGGFPECARSQLSVPTVQKLLREDIVDKVLKRDMTALYGVRRVMELERVFLYLCLHDGGAVNVSSLAKELQSSRPAVENFLDLFEAAHLCYRLRPFGYGKEVLRGRAKYYLADPAIAPSVLLKGKALLEEDDALGVAVEAAVFKHLSTHFAARQAVLSYWRNKAGREVDIVAEVGRQIIPFEIKYRAKIRPADLAGLGAFCQERAVSRAYLVTRSVKDAGRFELPGKESPVPALKIPAPLFCWWLGASEHGVDD